MDRRRRTFLTQSSLLALGAGLSIDSLIAQTPPEQPPVRGRRIVLNCVDLEDTGPKKETPDYGALLQVADADQADQWSWNWSEGGLEL